jgi:glycosyltransferase involved in cell wall biosynthesis
MESIREDFEMAMEAGLLVDNAISTKPQITVFMAVYNGARYLNEAIDSALNQTFKDFELLIIDDGSTDQSAEIIQSYKDPRIRFLRNEKNLGIVATRNRGIKEMRGDYLAILDCDDVSPPSRLKKELSFLKKNHDFGLVGGKTKYIDQNGEPAGVILKYNFLPEKFPALLLFTNCFSNSAVMIRTSALPPDGYRDFGGACEYDLWTRMAKKWRLKNLPHIMLKYRTHDKSMTLVSSQQLEEQASQIIKNQLADLKIFPSHEELLIHQTNFACRDKNPLEFLCQRDAWLQKLKKANCEAGVYAEPGFSKVLAERWLDSCATNACAGRPVWRSYWQSPLSQGEKDWVRIFKFAIRCALKI